VEDWSAPKLHDSTAISFTDIERSNYNSSYIDIILLMIVFDKPDVRMCYRRPPAEFSG